MQTQITDAWIKKHNPCNEALNLWDKKERDSFKILKWLMEIKKYDWANWFIVRVMTYKQYVSYAVYAAEQVIDIYEKQYPADKRPRKAIEAAKKCIVSPKKENKAAARSAESAAWSAARSAAWSAARSAAESAAESAARSAWSAAWSAWSAAESAADDAVDAAAYAAAMKKKILEYGVQLLKGA